MFEFEKKLKEEAQLRALSEVTYKTYYYRLKRLYNYYQKPLSQLSLQELRHYFLYLINVKKSALQSSGLNKKATPHTLRHCYATHLLEAGANIKAISKFLGHKSLRPTMIYLHLTNNAEEHSYNILNEIMSDL